MTLCVAWIRNEKKSQELVFATDSTLTGGEKWNHGIKLFELPRKDCLICFAGETNRAYPLILNLISTLKHDEKLQDSRLDIQEVLNRVESTFTDLVKSIFDKPSGDSSYIGSEAKFIFGGWSWKQSRFRIWTLKYITEIESFVAKEETQEEERSRVCVFLGDPEGNIDKGENDIASIAANKYQDLLTKKGKFDGKLDMEPLEVLVGMSRDRGIYYVDGALQIAKIYSSATNEFFGIKWPSEQGIYTFLGKKYETHTRPRVKYYDPDSCDITTDDVPKCLRNIEDFNNTEDYSFLVSCYSQESNYLKSDLTDDEREKLISIFHYHSYRVFIQNAEKEEQVTE